MKLIVASMVRNEASKFWRSALDAWDQFADEIVVLDDDSEDATREIAEGAGAHVVHRYGEHLVWGEEATPRAELWMAALQVTSPGDFIFVLDADMIPANNPKDILHDAVDSVSFRLFDLWGEDERGTPIYRHDGYWQGHVHYRMWCVRRPESVPEEGWLWSARGIHTGHFPTNLDFGRIVYAPLDYSLLHYAYSSQELRERKAVQYESVADQLTAREQQHALSILHPKPALSRLPFPTSYSLNLANDG